MAIDLQKGTIDLHAAKAARREGKAAELRLTIDPAGDPILLPAELPLDVLGPLRDLEIDEQLSVIFQARSGQQAEQYVRDLLTIRPRLFTDLIGAGTAVLERLFCSCDTPPWDRDPIRPGETDDEAAAPSADVALRGEIMPATDHDDDCGWTRWTAWRPSPQDLKELAVALWEAYGASLGEAFAPPASSGGASPTSRRTSKRTTASTRGGSGKNPARTGS